MTLAQRARFYDGETTVEERLRKTLSPWTACSQVACRIQCQFSGCNFAVRIQHSLRVVDAHPTRHFRIEGMSELGEASCGHRESRGHSVTAEFLDQARLLCGNRIEDVTNV